MDKQDRKTEPASVGTASERRSPRFLVQWWPSGNQEGRLNGVRAHGRKPTQLPVKEPVVLWATRFAAAVALACLVAGLLTVVGWWAGGPPWSTTVGEPPMLPFTALTVAILGALLAARMGRADFVRMSHFGALTIAGITGALLLLEFLPGGPAFLQSVLADRTPSPQTLLPLMLVAAALAASPSKFMALRRYEWFAIAAALTAFLGLMARLFDLDGLYQVPTYYTSPGHALLLMLLLSLGVLASRPRVGLMRSFASDTSGGLMLRRLLLAFVIFPVAWGWLVVMAERNDLLNGQTGTALTVLGLIVASHVFIWRNATAVNRASFLRAEAEEQRLQLELLVRNTTDYAIMMLDPQGRVVSWNEGAEHIMGYTESEVVGQHFALFYTEEDLAHDRPRQIIRQAFIDNHVREEGLRVRKDGTRFWAEEVVAPIRADNGRLIGYSKIVRDLTERKEAEAHRQQVEAMQHAERLKDQFLSILSHELRTPINAITGFGSILEDELAGPLTDTQHRYIRKMLSGADILLALVNDLLDMSRMQAGRFSLNVGPVRFQDVLGDVADHLRPLAEQKHDELAIRVPDDLPEIQADAQRIGQILTNLVNNAIKFTPEGGIIAVSARIEGDRLICEVTDTGIGIAEEDLPKLFQRFSQVDSSMTRKVTGTGLGLSISKALVEAHGGEIGVRSQLNVGSTFWFALPVDGPAPDLQAPTL